MTPEGRAADDGGIRAPKPEEPAKRTKAGTEDGREVLRAWLPQVGGGPGGAESRERKDKPREEHWGRELSWTSSACDRGYSQRAVGVGGARVLGRDLAESAMVPGAALWAGLRVLEVVSG